MASKSYQFRSVALDRAPLGRRASGLALAVGVNLLLLLALLGIGAFRPATPSDDVASALVVDLLPESERESAPAARQKAARPVERSRPQPPKPPVIPPITSPIPPRVPLQMIELTRQDYAAADIAKLPKAGPADAGAGGNGADDSPVVGRGPHGETLYAAEWARHPTDAELTGYLKQGAPNGYGLIACKTAPGNRVEDCVELDQSPRGSHLASAVRQAAWQFRVRPPRKNGQPMIGEWVSIRIDYTFATRTQ